MSQTEKYSELFNFMNEAVKFFEEKEPEFKKCVMEQFDKQLDSIFPELKEAIAVNYASGKEREVVQSSQRFFAEFGGRRLDDVELNTLLQEWWKKYKSKTKFINVSGVRLMWCETDDKICPYFGKPFEIPDLPEWDSEICRAVKERMDENFARTYDYVLSTVCDKIYEKIAEMKIEMKKTVVFKFSVNVSTQPEELLKAVGDNICTNLKNTGFFHWCTSVVHPNENGLIHFKMKISL
ncbi:MAG: hypothetical protein J6M02_07240 [Clostridia bacterium]|nr:hypothetical protein [Clostridia bacterium]